MLLKEASLVEKDYTMHTEGALVTDPHHKSLLKVQ